MRVSPIPLGVLSSARAPAAIPDALVDDFDGTLALWPNSYGNYLLQAGNSRVRLEHTAGYPAIYSDVVSLVGKAFVANVEHAAPALFREVYMAAEVDFATGNYVCFSQSGGTLLMRHVRLGVVSEETVPYDGTSMRWLRLRESSGSFYWDTSPDGVTWTQRYTFTSILNVSSVMLGVGAGDFGGGSPGVYSYIHRVGSPA